MVTRLLPQSLLRWAVVTSCSKVVECHVTGCMLRCQHWTCPAHSPWDVSIFCLVIDQLPVGLLGLTKKHFPDTQTLFFLVIMRNFHLLFEHKLYKKDGHSHHDINRWFLSYHFKVWNFSIDAVESVLFYFGVRGFSARLSANASIFGTLGGHTTALQDD